MKGFLIYFGLIFLYIILHLCHVSAQSVISNEITPDHDQEIPETIGTNGTLPQGSSAWSNFSMDNIGISDPSIRDYLTMVYGSLMGRPDCVKKSVCYAGQYLHGTPGSEFFFTMADRLVPDSFRTLFSILRDSVLNGQDCGAFVCAPQSSPR